MEILGKARGVMERPEKAIQLNSFVAGVVSFVIIAGVLLSPLPNLSNTTLLFGGFFGVLLSGFAIYQGVRSRYSKLVEGILVGFGYGLGFVSAFTVAAILAGIRYETVVMILFVPLALAAFPVVIGYIDRSVIASWCVTIFATLGFVFPLFVAGFPAIPQNTGTQSIVAALVDGILFAILIGGIIGTVGYVTRTVLQR
jgi:hypothetical protein